MSDVTDDGKALMNGEGDLVLDELGDVVIARVGGANRPAATPPPELFAVRVEQLGGADGGSRSAATWTYNVRTLGGDLLASGEPLARPRGLGSRRPGSGFGLAFYDGRSLKLWDAGETESRAALQQT